MRLASQDALSVPYGVDRWPLERLSAVRADPVAGLPLALIQPGAMLRINSGALDLPPPLPTETDSTTAQHVAAHLKRLYGGWNKAAGSFIDRYFAFLKRQIDRHRSELDERLAPFDGLFRAEDFIYSAPLPLPHAFLFAPSKQSAREIAAPTHFVQVDFAWWLGSRMVAVLLAPAPLTPAAARQRKERLQAAGIECADCTLADLDDAEFAWFSNLLGPEGRRFWEGEALPAAPSRRAMPDF
jgi:hypothetical protein